MVVARGVLLMILEKLELAKNWMEKELEIAWFSHRISRGKFSLVSLESIVSLF